MNRSLIQKRGFTKVELVVVVVIIIVLILLLLPVLQPAREDWLFRCQRRNCLKIIGLALHNYHDAYGTFPPAYIADADGQLLHSWRVLILPFLGEDSQGKKLYDQYDFSEPWNGPNNVKLLTQRPYVYGCPVKQDDSTMTAYAAIVGEPCVFAGTKPVTLKEVRDGTSNTIVIGEAVEAKIPWTKPQDVEFDRFTYWGDPAGFSSPFPVSGVFALRADGSVTHLKEEEKMVNVKALFTRAGGEEISPTD